MKLSNTGFYWRPDEWRFCIAGLDICWAPVWLVRWCTFARWVLFGFT